MNNDDLPQFAVLQVVDRDPDALTEHLSKMVAPVRVLPIGRKGLISSRGAIATAPGMRLWEGYHASGSEMVALTSLDTYAFYFPRSEGVRGLSGAAWRHAGVGQALIGYGDAFSSVQLLPGVAQRGFVLDRGLLLHRLSLMLDHDAREALAFEPVLETGRFEGVPRLAHSLLNSIMAGDFTDAPQTLAKLPALLADMVLELLPHSQRARLDQPRLMIAPHHVKKAIEYIQSNPLDPLPLDQLAQTVGVSVRTLQYGFKAYVGLSPSEYRRNVRLDRARLDLETGVVATPSAAAKRWGFVHLHRFRALYLRRFGAPLG